MSERNIVLYDGGCGFCRRIVDFTRPRMRSKPDLTFISLLSEEGEKVLRTLPLQYQQVDSLIFLDGHKVFVFSSAALKCLANMKWSFAIWTPLFWLVPLPIRDFIYRQVAKSRNSFFRQPLECQVEQTGQER
jgi:predicted DCC family thiol-disulfide oxidoreductase YuxK